MCIFLIRYFKKKLSWRFYSKYLPEHFVSPMRSLKLNVEARKPPTTYVSLRPVRAITGTNKVCLAEIAGPHNYTSRVTSRGMTRDHGNVFFGGSYCLRCEVGDLASMSLADL